MQTWVIVVVALVVILLGVWFWRRQQQAQAQQQQSQQLQQLIASTVPQFGAAQAPVAAPAAASAAGVAKQRRTVDVTDQELAAYLQDPSRPSVVLFYSPKCGHCNAMKDAYEKYGELAGPKVHVLRIDCARFGNVADQQRIDGFPTIKLFQNGQAVKEYQGDRKVGSFMVFQSGN